MTTDLFDLPPSNDRFLSRPGWRFWLSLTASGLLIGALYAVWTHPGGGDPDPEAGESQALAAPLAGLKHAAEDTPEQSAEQAMKEEPAAVPRSATEPLPKSAAPKTPLPGSEPSVEPADERLDDDSKAAALSPLEGVSVDVAPDTVEYATDGAYYVQVASYRSQEDADAHAARLSDRGLPAQARAYGGPSAGWWHTVRLGPFEGRAEAETTRFQLERHERIDAYVLPRSNGKYHVQVASFASREKAEAIAKGFAAQGHSTKISRVRMSGSYWHCVRIGPFDSRDEAAGYKKLVKDIPGTESTVIPFGPPLETASR